MKLALAVFVALGSVDRKANKITRRELATDATGFPLAVKGKTVTSPPLRKTRPPARSPTMASPIPWRRHTR